MKYILTHIRVNSGLSRSSHGAYHAPTWTFACDGDPSTTRAQPIELGGPHTPAHTKRLSQGRTNRRWQKCDLSPCCPVLVRDDSQARMAVIINNDLTDNLSLAINLANFDRSHRPNYGLATQAETHIEIYKT